MQYCMQSTHALPVTPNPLVTLMISFYHQFITELLMIMIATTFLDSIVGNNGFQFGSIPQLHNRVTPEFSTQP